MGALSLIGLPYRLAFLATVALGLVAGYFSWAAHEQDIGEARATERYNAAISALKQEAAAILAAETAKVETAEKTLQDFKVKQEVQDAQNQKKSQALAARVRSLTDASGRLRDPNSDAGCRESGNGAKGGIAASPGNSQDHGAETGGLLSRQLSEFLFEQAAGADAINLAYISCRADGENLRRIIGGERMASGP